MDAVVGEWLADIGATALTRSAAIRLGFPDRAATRLWAYRTATDRLAYHLAFERLVDQIARCHDASVDEVRAALPGDAGWLLDANEVDVLPMPRRARTLPVDVVVDVVLARLRAMGYRAKRVGDQRVAVAQQLLDVAEPWAVVDLEAERRPADLFGAVDAWLRDVLRR